MYILNLFQPTLTDKQKEELFSKESFDEMMKKLNEKKEIEEMKNLEELLADKLEAVYEKTLKLNEKAEISSLSTKDKALKSIIEAMANAEVQLDHSLESFAKYEDSISEARELMKPKTIEAWEIIGDCFEDEVEDTQISDDHTFKYYCDGEDITDEVGSLGKEKLIPLPDEVLRNLGKAIKRAELNE